jgi:hypothetical protein
MLRNGNILVKHREFLERVDNTSAFTVRTYPLNPGLPESFPWLHNIAKNYETYRFRRCDLHYVNSRTGTVTGEVILGVDYDASDPAPASEASLQTYEGTVTSVISEPSIMKASPQRLHKLGPSRFIRLGDLADNQDVKLYDAGFFILATVDGDDAHGGRIFIDYEIELMTAQSGTYNDVTAKVQVVGVSAAAPLGTSLTKTGSLPVEWLSGTTLRIPIVGDFLIYSIANGTGISVPIRAGFSGLTNAVGFDYGATSSGSAQVSYGATGIRTLSRDNVIIFGGTASSLTAFTFRICRYNNDLA